MQRIGAVERVDDIFVGIHHLRQDVVYTLLEGPQKIALADGHAAAVPRERIDRHILDERIGLRAVTPERGEKDTLHKILVHLYRVEETVAYADRVGLDAAADYGRVVVHPEVGQRIRSLREGGYRQSGKKYRYKRMSHRCLNSLINSTT